MNAKKAKALRKLARTANEGGEERHLVQQATGTARLTQDGRPVSMVKGVNDIKSTRGIYRYLKRQAGAFQPINKSRGEPTNGKKNETPEG